MGSVQFWGNSLAVRLPKHVIDEMKIKRGDRIKFRIVNGKIVLVPMREKKLSLEALVAQITPENRPEQFEWGAVGEEIEL